MTIHRIGPLSCPGWCEHLRRMLPRLYIPLKAVLVCGVMLAGQRTAAQEVVIDEIHALLDTLETATWVQTSWERLGDREERTAARCTWAGQDNMRLDVFDGRGAGATAILSNGRVYGFKRGLLSIFKRSYEPAHPRVRSLRGNTMQANGFLDDLEEVVTSGESIRVEKQGPETVVLRYRDSDGLKSTLHIRRDPIRVYIHERSDDDGIVERYTYSEVRYNPKIDLELLKP